MTNKEQVYTIELITALQRAKDLKACAMLLIDEFFKKEAAVSGEHAQINAIITKAFDDVIDVMKEYTSRTRDIGDLD